MESLSNKKPSNPHTSNSKVRHRNKFRNLLETDEENETLLMTSSEMEALSEEFSDTASYRLIETTTTEAHSLSSSMTPEPRSMQSKEPRQVGPHDQHNGLPNRKPKEMIVRTIFGIFMAFSYLGIVFVGFIPVAILLLFIQVAIFKEIIGIAHTPSRERKLPWFRCITWYFLICSLYYLYGEEIFEAVYKNIRPGTVQSLLSILIEYHKFISYLLHSFGFVVFVLNLHKGHYRFQFRQLGFTLLVLMVVFYQSKCFLKSLFQGRIWVVLPISLVVINDICAYFFGKAFGKTPLIKVSPKKTVEGFIGGLVATLIWAFFFSWFLMLFPQLFCPYHCKVNDNSHSCGIYYEQLFQKKQFDIFPRLGISISIYSIQFHALIMAIFASLIAPFGGFFASGFKRANKIKDFASSIPGHGGVTDRMDCQLLMGLFSYLYVKSFLRNEHPVDRMLKLVLKKLNPSQIAELIVKLQEILKQL